MTEHTKKALTDGLRKAMQAERDGQHFYLMAAETTKDPKGREVFARLADEERRHFDYLEAQYRSVVETGGLDTDLSLGDEIDLSGDSPFFSDAIRARIKDAHFEMTALSVGIQLELGAQRYYTEQAEASEDPAVKTFYSELAAWESRHYHALLTQQETLKKDYWADSGFSPF